VTAWLGTTSDARGEQARRTGTGIEFEGTCALFAVVLELLGRHGGAKEILQVLEDVLLGRRKGARLGVGVELIGHCHGSEDALLTW